MASLWQSFLDSPDYSKESPVFPNPFICVRDLAISGTREALGRLPWNGVQEWLDGSWYWISRSNYNDPAVIYLPLLIAVGLTFLRLFLNWILFKRIPKWCDFTKDAADKFPESIWKSIFYSISWPWSIYLLTSGPINYFFDLGSHFRDWEHDMTIGPGLHWLYMFEMGFYLHSIYATVYLETIRKDFVVMMLHHLLTFGLLLFSYAIRFHIIGLLLLSLYDVGDALLEISKTIVYFKDRGDKNHPIMELIANIGFGIFTVQHLMCRIYWYFSKVIYSAQHVSVIVYPAGPFYLLFVPMLWALYAMQVYWFKLILQLLWKIVVLREELADNRDFEEEQEKKRKMANGKKLD